MSVSSRTMVPSLDPANLPGPFKAAVLLIALGLNRAAEVFRHLAPDEVESLSLEMAKMRAVSSQTSEAIVSEAVATVIAERYLAEGGVEYARDVLERSFGPDRAAEIMGRLSAVIERRPFEFLRRTPSEQMFAFPAQRGRADGRAGHRQPAHRAGRHRARRVRARGAGRDRDPHRHDGRDRLVLKEVDQKDLALALRGVSGGVKDRLFRNLSERGSEMLREEIEYQPAQRRRVVEEAQGRIVDVVRRLEEAGAIVIARGDGEDELVD